MWHNWQTKRLSEVSDVFDGPHATPKTVDSGPIFLGIGALQDGIINLGETRHVTEDDFKQWTRRVCPQPDDVVFSYETRLGQAAIIPQGLECCLGRRMGLVRFKGGAVDPRFFLYQYLSPPFREFLDSKTIRGATVDRFSIKDFPSFPIAVPPLPEQQRIVAILDKAFAAIATAKANAEKNLQNAHALFESHLQSVFAQRGPGWVDSTIGAEIKFIDYRGKTPVKTPSGIRLITAKNVKMGYLQEVPMEFIACASYKGWMTRGIPQKGDVLFTTEAPLANVAQLDTDEKVAFAQRIIIMQPNVAKLDGTFLKYLLLSQPVQQRIRIQGTGATVQGIKASLLKTIEISFPRLLTEQAQIVTKLDDLREQTQRLASIYQQKLASLEELKKSILQKAFAGEL